ncbi:MAG: anthranilate phosphoribosyltransferase [Micrococcaceae bacterium]
MKQNSWNSILSDLENKNNLSQEQTSWVMREVMSGQAPEDYLERFLVLLREKGETVDELNGLVETMLQFAEPAPFDQDSIDIVGTGGDGFKTVNISTMAALVIAGAGKTVVKHGNRAASSASGSADVLEALGVNLNLQPEKVIDMASDTGITFAFAQVFHPAMKHAASVRKRLAVATTFNFLGPLTNPARPSASAIGVTDAYMAPLMAELIAKRGDQAIVFRGEDGLDELSTTCNSHVWLIYKGEIKEIDFDPEKLGLHKAKIEDLKGADAAFNAQVTQDFLAGKKGPIRDIVLLNAAIGILAADLHEIDFDSIEDHFYELLTERMKQAEQAVDSGRAAHVLEDWVVKTQDEELD